MTIRPIYAKKVKQLAKQGIPQPDLEVRIALSHILQIEPFQVYTLERHITFYEWVKIWYWFYRKKRGVPTAYLVGQKEFCHLIFYVDKRVLVPRPETEELVAWIQDNHSKRSIHRLLDVCTGSGCLGITLADLLQPQSLYLTDISQSALQVAQANAQAHRSEGSYTILQSNVLDKLKTCSIELFDLIVANPPYILPWEKEQVDSHVWKYEPKIALIVPGMQWMEDFIQSVYDYLVPGGWFYLENNPCLMQAILEMLRQKGFSHMQVKKDLSSKDRFIRAKK